MRGPLVLLIAITVIAAGCQSAESPDSADASAAAIRDRIAAADLPQVREVQLQAADLMDGPDVEIILALSLTPGDAVTFWCDSIAPLIGGWDATNPPTSVELRSPDGRRVLGDTRLDCWTAP